MTGLEPAMATSAGFAIPGHMLPTMRFAGIAFVVTAVWLVMARGSQRR